MPYINEERRELVSHLGLDVAEEGDVNYLITSIIDEWLDREGLSYASINAAIGILECAKLELYRRIAAPYEDEKLEANGDVFTCNLNK